MTQMLIVIAIVGVVALGSIWVGFRIGAARAVRNAVEGFVRHPDLNCTAKQLNKIGRAFRHGRARGNWNDVGRVMAELALEVASSQNPAESLKSHEARVAMNRDDLSSIGWLADYGLRAWATPNDNGIRRGERMAKDIAEKLTTALDIFEQKIADPLFETKQANEARLASREDRMKRISQY